MKTLEWLRNQVESKTSYIVDRQEKLVEAESVVKGLKSEIEVLEAEKRSYEMDMEVLSDKG